jgi:SSS family solute:Na+ symporter
MLARLLNPAAVPSGEPASRRSILLVVPTSDTTAAGLSLFDYVMVVAYLVATVAIVVWSVRRQKDTEDFFLGNRRLPWLAVGLSIMATLLSSLTYVGLTGEVVKNGIAAFMMQVAILPAALMVIPVFIPFFMRMRFTSAYEYLEHRFDYPTRLLGSGLFLLLRVGWVSMVMYSGSLALATMAGWNLYTVILVLGLAATVYTCFGGLEGVVWTDVLQAIMLFGGAAAIVLYVWLDTGVGPVAWWHEAGKHSAAHAQPEWFSLDPYKRMTLGTALIAGFFWQVCTHCSDQVVLQRYAATPSLSAARRSYVTNLVSVLSITSLLGLSGLALLYFYVLHPEELPPGTKPTEVGDKLMPHFFANQLPIGFGGLILANFLCDAMQTLVSGVNSVTAVASQDLLEHRRHGAASESLDAAATSLEQGTQQATSVAGHRLVMARLLTLGMGVLTTLIALAVAAMANSSGKNIIDLMPRTFNMFLGPLGALFLIGMFQPRATGRSAFPAVIGALVLSILWSYCREIFDTPYDLSISWAIGTPCVFGLVLAWILSQFVDTGEPHHGDRFTWWEVMKRPVPEPATNQE